MEKPQGQTDVDKVLGQIGDVLAKLAEQVGELGERVAVLERDFGTLDKSVAALLTVTREHGQVLRAILRPEPVTPRKVLN